MDTDEIDVFLTLAEELHFGRTADRLRLPQPRVSRLVAALERRCGGRLFERTSRSVRITPLGEQLRADLQAAYGQMRAALSHAQDAARQVAGVLRIGFTATTATETVTYAIEAFTAENPRCRVDVIEVSVLDPWTPLRRGDIDVEFNHLAVDPDLTAGPPADYGDRVLVVARDHPLARRESVSIEDLADWEVALPPATFPHALYDAIIPPRTPSGRTIQRTWAARTISEIVSLAALGRIVHPTVGYARAYLRDDLARLPIRDMPPLPVGPVWCTAHDNARVRALVHAVRGARRRTPAGA